MVILQSLKFIASIQQQSMKSMHSAHTVASSLNSYLLNKMQRFLVKKQQLSAQMNTNTLDQLATIITQTNQQLNYSVHQSNIPDVQDHTNIKVDSLMSVPENRVTKLSNLQSRLSPYSSINETKRISNYSRSRREYTVSQRSRSITSHSKSVTPRKSTVSSSSRVFQPLDIAKDEEQERYVQALRLTKKLQEQRLLKQMQMAQELRQKRLNNDWSNKNVMFDFQCRITKIEGFKPKPNLRLGYLDPKINQTTSIDKNKLTVKEGNDWYNQEIKEKVNVTYKAQQQEENKLKRRGLFRANQNVKPDLPAPTVIVNFQTHEETEGAIRLMNDGIKLKLNHREFSTINDPPPVTELTIKSRMNRSQYIEFKKVEESRKGSKIKMMERVKPRSKSQFKVREQNKVQKTEEELAQAKLEELQAKSQSSLKVEAKQSLVFGSTNRATTITNESRVKVFNRQLHNELLREQKRKHVSFLGDGKQAVSPNSRRQRLSEVDKYNLLYLKHSGNPPDYLQEVTESLKTSTVEMSKDRENLVKASLGKKFNLIGQSRIVNNRQERAIKTTNR